MKPVQWAGESNWPSMCSTLFGADGSVAMGMNSTCPVPQMSSETLCHTLTHPDPGGPHHIATYGESAEIWEMLPGSDLKWLEASGVSAASGPHAYLCRTLTPNSPPSLYLPSLSSVTLGLWSCWPECAASLPALCSFVPLGTPFPCQTHALAFLTFCGPCPPSGPNWHPAL